MMIHSPQTESEGIAQPSRPFASLTSCVTFEVDDNWLEVRIGATALDMNRLKRLMEEVARECTKRGSKRVLLINKALLETSISEMFHFVQDWPSLDTCGVPVSIFNQNPDNAALCDFMNLVSNNRGIRLQSFDDQCQAEAWLRTFEGTRNRNFTDLH